MPNFAALAASSLASDNPTQTIRREPDYVPFSLEIFAQDEPFLFECLVDCLGLECDIPEGRKTNPRAIAFRRHFYFFRSATKPPAPKHFCPLVGLSR